MSDNESGSQREPWRPFLGLAIVGVLLLAIFLFAHVFHFLLVMFGAVLVGVCLQGLTAWVSERTSMRWLASLSVVLLLLLSVMGGFAVLAGPQIVEQVTTLIDRFPSDLAKLEGTLAQYEWGRVLIERLPPAEEVVPSRGQIMGSLPEIFIWFHRSFACDSAGRVHYRFDSGSVCAGSLGR